jgi:tetratricopeptide (TPR) repeat protein
MNKFLLPLLLVASTAHAATLERVNCGIGPTASTKAELENAQRTVDDARTDPAHPLVLADALADLAWVVSRTPPWVLGKPENSGELIGQARDIWAQAKPDPALAAQLQERGRRYATAGRCALAKPVLQVSLDMAEKTQGKDGQQTLEAVNDLLRVALAQNDSATVKALAPRVVESPEAQQKLRINLGNLYEDLGDFYYHGEEYAKAEPLTRRSLELARQDKALSQKLTYKLASVYYGELRYAEAEALIAPFKSDWQPAEPQAGRQRTRDRMAEMVRAGNLAGALALGEQALEQHLAEAASSAAAFAEAEATFKSSPKSGPVHDKALADGRKAHARAASDNLAAGAMLNYLGEIHHAMNELSKAETLYLQAQARLGTAEGFVAPEATRNTSDLAILYRMRGEPERALPLQEQVLKKLLPLLGSEHPDVLESQRELALIRQALQR